MQEDERCVRLTDKLLRNFGSDKLQKVGIVISTLHERSRMNDLLKDGRSERRRTERHGRAVSKVKVDSGKGLKKVVIVDGTSGSVELVDTAKTSQLKKKRKRRGVVE